MCRAFRLADRPGHLFRKMSLIVSWAFEDLATGGSFIVFNQNRNMLDMVRNFTHFFTHESCGFCTPCRPLVHRY